MKIIKYEADIDTTLNYIKKIVKNFYTDIYKLNLHKKNLKYIENLLKKIPYDYTEYKRKIEVLKRPIRLLETGKGDCDDKAIFLMCWAKARHFKAGFLLGNWEEGGFHIVPVLFRKNDMIIVETTYPNKTTDKIWGNKMFAARIEFV